MGSLIQVSNDMGVSKSQRFNLWLVATVLTARLCHPLVIKPTAPEVHV